MEETERARAMMAVWEKERKGGGKKNVHLFLFSFHSGTSKGSWNSSSSSGDVPRLSSTGPNRSSRDPCTFFFLSSFNILLFFDLLPFFSFCAGSGSFSCSIDQSYASSSFHRQSGLRYRLAELHGCACSGGEERKRSSISRGLQHARIKYVIRREREEEEDDENNMILLFFFFDFYLFFSLISFFQSADPLEVGRRAPIDLPLSVAVLLSCAAPPHIAAPSNHLPYLRWNVYECFYRCFFLFFVLFHSIHIYLFIIIALTNYVIFFFLKAPQASSFDEPLLIDSYHALPDNPGGQDKGRNCQCTIVWNLESCHHPSSSFVFSFVVFVCLIFLFCHYLFFFYMYRMAQVQGTSSARFTTILSIAF